MLAYFEAKSWSNDTLPKTIIVLEQSIVSIEPPFEPGILRKPILRKEGTPLAAVVDCLSERRKRLHDQREKQSSVLLKKETLLVTRWAD